MEGDAYLVELARYVVLNPVRAGMVRAAEDWAWSNYRALAKPLAGFARRYPDRGDAMARAFATSV